MTDSISYAALQIDRETALRRLRAWQKHADACWVEGDERHAFLERARSAALGNKDRLPYSAVDDFLTFAYVTPNDDDIEIQVEFEDHHDLPAPVVQGALARIAHRDRVVERVRFIRNGPTPGRRSS